MILLIGGLSQQGQNNLKKLDSFIGIVIFCNLNQIYILYLDSLV